jgi:hypothetical protein
MLRLIASNIIRSSDDDDAPVKKVDPLETLVNKMTSKNKDFSTIFSLGTMNRILKGYAEPGTKLNDFDKKLIFNFFKDTNHTDLNLERKEIVKASGLRGYRMSFL